MDAAWSGHWAIDPQGPLHSGNVSQQVPSDLASLFKGIQTDPSPVPGNLVDRLVAGRDGHRVIQGDEIALVLQLFTLGEDKWELVKEYPGVKVMRYNDHSLFHGCLFGKIFVHVPHATKEQVAHSILNFEERATWDKQVAGFTSWPAPMGNELIRCRIHAPPFSDRDFSVFHCIARHVDGKGILTYQRYADDNFAPPGRDVRGHLAIIATTVTDHPKGGASFSTCTVLDPRIPFMPKWIINAFIPAEFRKWADGLAQNCAKLQAAGTPLPCAVLFTGIPKAMPCQAPAATVGDAAEPAAEPAAGGDAAFMPVALPPPPLPPPAEAPPADVAPGNRSNWADEVQVNAEGQGNDVLFPEDLVEAKTYGGSWVCGCAPCAPKPP